MKAFDSSNSQKCVKHVKFSQDYEEWRIELFKK